MKTLVNLFIATLFMFFTSCTTGAPDVQAGISEDTSALEESSITEVSLTDSSDITCPKCGFSTIEELPTDVCLLSYDCQSCGEVMHPAQGDCCVFCTHGSEKCPSMQ